MSKRIIDTFERSIAGLSGPPEKPETTPDIEAFLKSSYLEQPYLVAPEAASALATSVKLLQATIPGFECIVNVGGTSNGSLLLRRLERPRPATDLDIYFVGRSAMRDYLS